MNLHVATHSKKNSIFQTFDILVGNRLIQTLMEKKKYLSGQDLGNSNVCLRNH